MYVDINYYFDLYNSWVAFNWLACWLARGENRDRPNWEMRRPRRRKKKRISSPAEKTFADVFVYSLER